jgi:mannose-6-phosphate isomerase-like protein (cupin superfamily)
VDRIDAVISGRFRMVVAGHFAILGPGDWVEIPRGVHHSAAVVGDEPVTGMDAARVTGLDR